MLPPTGFSTPRGGDLIRVDKMARKENNMRASIKMLLERLENYPGAHPNEKWKLERDLTKCTQREKEEMKRYGLTTRDFIMAGLDRGQVAHILFGYKVKPKNKDS